MATAAIGLTGLTQAHAQSAPIELQVVDRETGQPLRVWRHDGRLFVAGAPGDRYGLRVTNHTGGRVLVVMSVDGVNILSGETAGYDQRGYVFGPYQSYDLVGWRKSLSEVADFTFTRLPQSYAALTGRPANVGVIGVAAFEEKVAPEAAQAPAPPPLPDEAYRGEVDRAGASGRAMTRNVPRPPDGVANGTAVTDIVVTAEKRASRRQSAPAAVAAFASRSRDAAAAEPSDEKLGTGHGEREQSVTTLVQFERATPYPQFTEEITYDTHDNLVALGVIPAWRYGERQPRPFPASPASVPFQRAGPARRPRGTVAQTACAAARSAPAMELDLGRTTSCSARLRAAGRRARLLRPRFGKGTTPMLSGSSADAGRGARIADAAEDSHLRRPGSRSRETRPRSILPRRASARGSSPSPATRCSTTSAG